MLDVNKNNFVVQCGIKRYLEVWVSSDPSDLKMFLHLFWPVP